VHGRGKRLLAEPGDKVPLKLTASAAFETGVLNLTYPGHDPWQFQAPPGDGPVAGPDITHDGAHAGCPVTKDHSDRTCLRDPAMPGTRGHAGPLLPSVRRARTTCYARLK